MTDNVFGKRSYEYAIGSVQASRHPLLTAEQWTRLQEADGRTAEKLLHEFGYPAAENGMTVRDAIDGEQRRAAAFIRSLAPDESLTDTMFFEEDATNLKLFLKAKRLGRSPEGLPLAEGSIAPDVLRVCAELDDYSLLGEDLAAMLEGVGQEEDGCRLSCRVDSAMFVHALETVKKKRCAALAELYRRYAVGRNRLTALRLRQFPAIGERVEAYAFLPVEWDAERRGDENRTAAEIMQSCNEQVSRMMTDLGYDNGMGVLARYYFTKKSEAAALRLLFTEKSLSGKGGVL